ncbi:hypothetical protein, partial [Pseudomonas syringae group genomosp. 3]
LRQQGIEANATPRRVRGVVRKPEKQVVRQIERRGAKPRTKVAQRADAELEAVGKGVHVNPAKSSIQKSRKNTHQAYGRVARALAAGDSDDKRLALDIVNFIKQLPPPLTQHDELVQQLKKQKTTNRSSEKTKPTQQRNVPGDELDKSH